MQINLVGPRVWWGSRMWPWHRHLCWNRDPVALAQDMRELRSAR